jgi:hypothetical protein
MSGFLTFSSTLHDEDADPLHGRYTDPNATIQMMFSGILSSLSGTLIGPMTIDIFLQPTLPPFRALWNVSVVGADGRSASFGLGNYGLDDWQDDTAANLLRLGEGATSDFFLTGPGYSVYGPSSARRLQSVPEPSTLLLSMGGVIAAVWLRRRR